MRVELGLAWASMRHRPAAWLLLALGLAIAAALPVLAAGLRTESAVAAVTQTVTALPAAQRTVLAVTAQDLRGDALARADATVSEGFQTAGLTPVERVLTFRPLAAGGAEFGVGAVDGLEQAVRLDAGRLPRTCLPTRCEVVLITDGSGTAAERDALTRGLDDLGITATGTAGLVDQRLTGSGLVSTSRPLLLGADPDALAELTSLSLFGRNRAWLAPLDPGAVTRAGVAAFTGRLATITEQVNATTGPLTLSWPDTVVAAAADRAAAAADRFTVLGAGAGVLQLGFALVTAAGIRRRSELTARLLARRGASSAQITAVTALQPLIAVASGLALGTVVAGLVVGLRAGLGARAAAADVAVGSAWPTLVGLGAVAVVLTVVIRRWPADSDRFTGLAFDVILVGAAVGAGWMWWVSGGGAGSPLAASLIVMLSVLSGLVAARLWRPAVTAVARLAGTRSPVWQLGLVAGRRRPLLPMVTAGFLAAACCSVVFAGGYQQSLQRSATDQAAAQVPLDIRVSPSAQVAAPLSVLDPARLRALDPSVEVHPVVLSTVTAFAGSTSVRALPLVGLDAAVLPQLHEFAATTGATTTAATLAERLAGPVPPDQREPVVPAGTRRIGLRVGGMTNDATVNLWLGTPDGGQQRVDLTGPGPDLTAPLPAGPERAVHAIEIVESASHLMHRQHGIGEGAVDRTLVGGTLRLGALSAGGTRMPGSWVGWGSDQAEVSGAGDTTLTVRFRLGDQRVVLTPAFVPRTGLVPVPVAVDPGTAARAGARGTFGLTVNGLTVPTRIVAVIPRLPAVGPAFVLADRSVAVALLDRSAPGTAAVGQVWISAPGWALAAVRAVLENSPAASASITYRSDLARAVAEDPVATRSIWLLQIAGALAVLLAMVAAAVQVRAELEESAADHFALELDGLEPRRLRSVLLLRSASILAVGIPVGVIGGVVITEVAVRLVVTGPGGGAVEPPLRVVVAAGGTVLAVAAALVGCALTAGLAAAAAFRDPRLRQPELDLR